MSYLTFLCLISICIIPLIDGFEDPMIYDVKQLTFDGDHSFPIFSRDGRSIIFSASGPNYGTKCPHVYKLDLKTNQISLFSTGIGHESNPFNHLNSHKYSIVSTTYEALTRLSFNKPVVGTQYSNDFFCPQSLCEIPKGVLGKICLKPHTENFKGQTLTRIDYANNLVQSIDYYKKDVKQWDSQHLNFPFGEIFSQKCEAGECLMYRDVVGREEKNTTFNFGAFDGFNYNTLNENFNNEFFFHGYQTTNKLEVVLIKNGIVPTSKSKIFYTDYTNLIRGSNPDQCHPDDETMSYLYPHADPTMTFVLATGIDLTTGNKSIYQMKKPEGEVENPTLVSDSSINSFHASLDPTGQFIVFVSDRNGSNQLYLGKFNNKTVEYPKFEDNKPEKNLFYKKAIKNAEIYTMRESEKISYPRLNTNGVLMYTSTDLNNECSQIYQLDTKLNDLSAKRKISTGIHHHSSPNFLNNGDILFASTLTKQISNPANLNCPLRKCTHESSDDFELLVICGEIVEEMPLPKEMEIYISNEFGSLKRRLTANNVFDGEVVLSPDQTKFVFSQFEDGDYDLFEMELEGGNLGKRVITKKRGFERSPAYSPNSELIAFVASRPETDVEIDFYARRLVYDFVDIAQSKIHVFVHALSEEYEIKTPFKTNVAPVFLDNENLVFVAYNNSNECYLYGAQIVVKNDSVQIVGPFVIEKQWPYTREMYINPLIPKINDSFQLVFTHGNQYVYDLYMSNDFNPKIIVEEKEEVKSMEIRIGVSNFLIFCCFYLDFIGFIKIF